MPIITLEQSAANTMMAVAHLLTGQPDRLDALSKHMAIIVGAPLDMNDLMTWGERVRRTGRPIIHISWPDLTLPVPRIALAYKAEERVQLFESCSLWQPESGGGAYLLPADPTFGAFCIGGGSRLHHQDRQPFATQKAADAGYVRAYTRLLEIMKHQIEQGSHLVPLQQLERLAA